MRHKIKEWMKENSPNHLEENILRISPGDLKELYRAYDAVFFDGQLATQLQDRLKFSLSTRMTKAAGKTIYTKKAENRQYEIRIGVDFLFNFDALQREKNVAGLVVENSLEALMLVFEHELVHVLETEAYGTTNCKGKRFQKMAAQLFGHTSSYHALPSQREVIYEISGYKPGDQISFNYNGKKLKGTIHSINKRATVMVKDSRGDYADALGQRYTKYYVPIIVNR